MKLISIWIILINISLVNLFSQENLFTEKVFINSLNNYHPDIKRYNLLIEQGQANILRSKGAFDPYLYSNFNNKYFDEKNYYSILNGGVGVPFWYGFDIKADFEANNGNFLNPNQFVPQNGLFAAGIEIPILQGLFYDKRRANQNIAENFLDILKAEQVISLNEIILNGLKVYWDWVEAYNNLLVSKEAFEITKERFENIKQAFQLGDVPAIDTLESFIQLNERDLNLRKSELKEQKSRLELSSFIWNDENSPNRLNNIAALNYTENEVEVKEAIDTLDIDYLTIPEVKMLYSNYKELEIERRLKIEGLKPKLNIKYNFLTENFGDETFNNLNSNNYNWGLKFEMPLLFREGRGDLELVDIKLEQTDLKIQQKIYEIENKIKSLYIEYEILNSQVDLINKITQDYFLLLEAERTKFFSGESSVFLINSRELKYIEYKYKQIELKKNAALAYYKFLQSQGLLYQYFN